MNYKEIGFKCGVEIHNRLSAKHKLFCNCEAHFSEGKKDRDVFRKLRAVAGELGQVDVAAIHEYLKDRKFIYEVFPKTVCLVELDEEPPHPVNQEALMTALQVAKMLKADIPEEIHFMRKTIVDGSNTSAFQRTALIGMNGVLQTSKGPVRITNINLEEESAGIVRKKDGTVIYRLDRLGIPLVEIGTAPDIKDPEHAREVAEKLGMIVRSTGKSQRGIGVIRQDVNVSIKGGARVEVKGFQYLENIPLVIEKEIKRQQHMIKVGAKIQEETRLANPDGTTDYMRPLPGGQRLYPETDVPPIIVTKQMLAKIPLPETWENKRKRFAKMLPKDMVDQVLRSEYLDIFEKLAKKYDPTLVASVLTSTIKDLRRNQIPTGNLTEEHLENIFKAVKKGKVSKEAIPELVAFLSRNPSDTVGHAIEDMGIRSVTEAELRKIVKEVIKKNPEHAKERSMGPLMGDIMRRVRGSVDGKTVAKILKEELG